MVACFARADERTCPCHPSGSSKHTYAKKLLNRYQEWYGGDLQAEVSYKSGRLADHYGQKGSTRLDVYDPATGDVYDYKFVKNPGRGVSKAQQRKIRREGPDNVNEIIEVNPQK